MFEETIMVVIMQYIYKKLKGYCYTFPMLISEADTKLCVVYSKKF